MGMNCFDGSPCAISPRPFRTTSRGPAQPDVATRPMRTPTSKCRGMGYLRCWAYRIVRPREALAPRLSRVVEVTSLFGGTGDAGRLLTMREVAERLAVCTATVLEGAVRGRVQ